MHCTTSSKPVSTLLEDDPKSAYQRFRRNARTLGSISQSFDTLALGVTAAYYAALTRPAPEAWTTLVAQTASLVGCTHALIRIVPLDAKEREALNFFEAIVSENADLLGAPEPLARSVTRSH